MKANDINDNLFRLTSIILFYSLFLALVIPTAILSETASAKEEQNFGNNLVYVGQNKTQFEEG
jgi:hypothetical protein